MGQIRDRMQADLQIAGYSEQTQKVYIHRAARYVAYFGRTPEELGATEIRKYLHHLVGERGLSSSYLRSVRAALRFLYRVTLNRPIEIEWVPVPRRPRHLPQVLLGSEFIALLNATRNPKYRAIFRVMYAAGLRISEACALRCEQIDSSRMVIRVRGKGNKDRYTVLSRVCWSTCVCTGD